MLTVCGRGYVLDDAAELFVSSDIIIEYSVGEADGIEELDVLVGAFQGDINFIDIELRIGISRVCKEAIGVNRVLGQNEIEVIEFIQ